MQVILIFHLLAHSLACLLTELFYALSINLTFSYYRRIFSEVMNTFVVRIYLSKDKHFFGCTTVDFVLYNKFCATSQ